MFILKYRIVYNDWDDFPGQNGFLIMICNDLSYGEMYPKELDCFMIPMALYDWFERLIRVAQHLTTKTYVALSDVEAYDTWLEFERYEDELFIGIVRAEKPNDSSDIEFSLENVKQREGERQRLSFRQFKEELCENVRTYLDTIVKYNATNLEVANLEKSLQELLER